MLTESHTWKTLTDTDRSGVVKSRITIQNDIWVYEKGKEQSASRQTKKMNRHRMVHRAGDFVQNTASSICFSIRKTLWNQLSFLAKCRWFARDSRFSPAF
ncbi:hypothetical protein [Geobacillus subterraneus]|uniref:hypothetical protein n=1 Tax=Geobacillus subterraneus TaxID=129338 RepID=UPI00161B7351